MIADIRVLDQERLARHREAMECAAAAGRRTTPTKTNLRLPIGRELTVEVACDSDGVKLPGNLVFYPMKAAER